MQPEHSCSVPFIKNTGDLQVDEKFVPGLKPRLRLLSLASLPSPSWCFVVPGVLRRQIGAFNGPFFPGLFGEKPPKLPQAPPLEQRSPA